MTSSIRTQSTLFVTFTLVLSKQLFYSKICNIYQVKYNFRRIDSTKRLKRKEIHKIDGGNFMYGIAAFLQRGDNVIEFHRF